MSASVAVVIVAYRSADSLAACLASLGRRAEEIVVVDNGDDARTQAIVREAGADLIVNSTNRGFAGAVNQGVAATTAPYVLLFNPDCELEGGLEGLVEACGQEAVVAAGGELVGTDGQPQIGFLARSLPTPMALAFEALGIHRIWKKNPVNRRYRLLDLDVTKAQEVEQPAGAFLMLRRDALAAIGGLDESFHPVWFEDVDLCLRLRQAGGRIVYTPEAVARHSGGHSVNSMPLHLKQQAWYGSFLRFTGKHFSAETYRRLRSTVLLGLALRRIYCWVGGGSSAESAAYRDAFRLVRAGVWQDSQGTGAPISETSAAELS